MQHYILSTLFFFTIASAKLLASEVTTLETSLHDVTNPESLESEYSVYSNSNGRIYWVDAQNLELISKLKLSLSFGEEVELEIYKDEMITDVKSLGTRIEKLPSFMGHEKDLSLAQLDLINDDSSYTPTPLSIEDATVLFNVLNTRDTATSQCYKRAHTWAYDMFVLRPMNAIIAEKNPIDHGKYQELVKVQNGTGVQSMKVFLFYTRKFNRDCNDRQLCKWWFHVAPYVKVDGEDMVMDREFNYKHKKLNDWYKMQDFIGD